MHYVVCLACEQTSRSAAVMTDGTLSNWRDVTGEVITSVSNTIADTDWQILSSWCITAKQLDKARERHSVTWRRQVMTSQLYKLTSAEST